MLQFYELKNDYEGHISTAITQKYFKYLIKILHTSYTLDEIPVVSHSVNELQITAGIQATYTYAHKKIH